MYSQAPTYLRLSEPFTDALKQSLIQERHRTLKRVHGEKTLKVHGLHVDIAGLQLHNPTMLSSGILGYSAETWVEVEKAGAGGIVTKSVGLKSREGYSNPTVVQTDCGLINAMGLPNPGIDEFVYEIRKARSTLHVPLITSVYGFTAMEYRTVAKRAIHAGAQAVELNVSCPHVEETGSEIGQDPAVVARVVKEVKAAVNKPVFVKLSPNVRDIAEIACAADKAGADGLTIMNTVKAMAIDVETMMPVLSHRVGGLSGQAIKPIALRCVYEVYEQTKKPIIGCGGITNSEDALQFLLAGSSAIQVGTSLAFKNTGVFNQIVKGIESYLKRKCFGGVKEIVGMSHRK
jgi:dihydroorotate dehydrogenase (NAD+) catalytic subunit